MLTLREEIAKQLKFDATHPNLNESYISQADKIIKLIEKRIDSKLKILKKLDPLKDDIIYTQGYNSAVLDIMKILNKKNN